MASSSNNVLLEISPTPTDSAPWSPTSEDPPPTGMSLADATELWANQLGDAKLANQMKVLIFIPCGISRVGELSTVLESFARTQIKAMGLQESFLKKYVEAMLGKGQTMDRNVELFNPQNTYIDAATEFHDNEGRVNPKMEFANVKLRKVFANEGQLKDRVKVPELVLEAIVEGLTAQKPNVTKAHDALFKMHTAAFKSVFVCSTAKLIYVELL